jgi:uncharacterized cupin superfamily protein
MTSKRPIVNLADLELQPMSPPVPEAVADRYGARFAWIGPQVGAQKLGYNLTVVPPGKRAFPFHSHRVNEEMFFVLEGEGEIRIGDARYPIKQGDVVACPPGGPETAHQILNTSSKELRYLAVSTKMYPEIAEYPDSKKVGVLGDGMRFLVRAGESRDYWEGE